MPVVPRIALGNQLMFGFPSQLLTKLRYVDTYALVSTSGSVAKQVNCCNGIYDPDLTGVGHQPLYRDTFAAIYDQYAVVSTKIKATFNNLYDSTSFHAGIVMDDDGTTSSSPTTLMEMNLGKNVLLPPKSGSLSSRTLSIVFDAKRHLGIDPYTSETYKTAVTTNPTEQSTVLFWASPGDGAATGTVQVNVEMEFLVLFTELATPTGS